MSIYDIPLKTIDGKVTSLKEYSGKPILIVNTASKCGFTPQYEGLQALYDNKEYKAAGFTVLGFPSNDFGQQEPGTTAEIKEFCELKYHVKFPMFDKVATKGKEQHPLYSYLVSHSPAKEEKTKDVQWNFEKFLVDRQGKVVGRFNSKVKPESPELEKAIKATLK